MFLPPFAWLSSLSAYAALLSLIVSSQFLLFLLLFRLSLRQLMLFMPLEFITSVPLLFTLPFLFALLFSYLWSLNVEEEHCEQLVHA